MGAAAHPQSPYLEAGCNIGITDGCVWATSCCLPRRKYQEQHCVRKNIDGQEVEASYASWQVGASLLFIARQMASGIERGRFNGGSFSQISFIISWQCTLLLCATHISSDFHVLFISRYYGPKRQWNSKRVLIRIIVVLRRKKWQAVLVVVLDVSLHEQHRSRFQRKISNRLFLLLTRSQLKWSRSSQG